METYYQKHRSIQAFQFDGTWQQLETELPYPNFKWIFEDASRLVLEPEYTDENNKIEIQNHLITTLQLDDDTPGWPQSKKKIKHLKSYFNDMYGSYNRPKNVHKCKYDYKSNELHIHDYVVVKTECIEYKSRLANYGAEMETNLTFIKPANFKAHWSKQPIRKRGRTHANQSGPTISQRFDGPSFIM